MEDCLCALGARLPMSGGRVRATGEIGGFIGYIDGPRLHVECEHGKEMPKLHLSPRRSVSSRTRLPQVKPIAGSHATSKVVATPKKCSRIPTCCGEPVTYSAGDSQRMATGLFAAKRHSSWSARHGCSPRGTLLLYAPPYWRSPSRGHIPLN